MWLYLRNLIFKGVVLMKKVICCLIIVCLSMFSFGCVHKEQNIDVVTENNEENSVNNEIEKKDGFKVIKSMKMFGGETVELEYSNTDGRIIFTFPSNPNDYKQVAFVDEYGAIASMYIIDENGNQMLLYKKHARDVDYNEAGYISEIIYEHGREGYELVYNNVIENKLVKIGMFDWGEGYPRDIRYSDIEDLDSGEITDITYTYVEDERFKMFFSEFFVSYFCFR